jgi:glycosyltransferase involved in cell wall biosynthesis
MPPGNESSYTQVTVVIPTYNRCRTLAKTLGAVLTQTSGQSFDVVVIDDGSCDDTQRFMREMTTAHASLTYIRHEQNRGRVETRNDGITSARGDIVILLDDDNVPSAGFIDAHWQEHANASPAHVAVMGNVSFAPEVIEGSNFGRYMQSRYLGARPLRERNSIDFNDLPSRFFGTLNCSARRSDLLRVGLFDARYRYYGGEDENMGHALSLAGVRIVFAENARTVHQDEVSIARYKTKLIESAHYGLVVTSAIAPDYVASTRLSLVLPMDARRDSLRQLGLKFVIGLLCRPPVSWLLERWARSTDRLRWLYSWPLTRLLTASWVYYGYRLKGTPDARVEYAERHS